MAAQVDKLKQSDSHKIKADRRICAIFLPQLSIDSPSTLISTLHLLKPLAKEIFVITGNLSRDVISGDSITAANCLLPLSDAGDIDRALGSRHRAALGITEETDAVVVVVSEETRSISLAVDRKLIRNLSPSQLRTNLISLLS